MKILYDSEIEGVLTYAAAIKVLKKLLRSKLDQNVVHPPRHYFPTQKGALPFTIGELIQEQVAGFRLYGSPKSTQLTFCMDTHSGEFKGMIIGKLIGVMRTACINAVAMQYLARKDAEVLGVLGSGFQARHHALAALEVRDFKEIRVYSRNSENQQGFIRFVEEKAGKQGLNLRAVSKAEEAVKGCDVLITASNSPTPILEMDWLTKGLHINNVGPKHQQRHELPIEAYVQADVLTTDSLPQMTDPAGPGKVCFGARLPVDQIKGLEAYMEGWQRDQNLLTLFCSMGLAGSEVALADWILEEMEGESKG